MLRKKEVYKGQYNIFGIFVCVHYKYNLYTLEQTREKQKIKQNKVKKKKNEINLDISTSSASRIISMYIEK